MLGLFLLGISIFSYLSLATLTGCLLSQNASYLALNIQLTQFDSHLRETSDANGEIFLRNGARKSFSVTTDAPCVLRRTLGFPTSSAQSHTSRRLLVCV